MSTLDQELEDYLSLRRAMGFKLARAEKLLNQFLVYMAGRHADVVTTDLALAWAMTPTDASPRWWDHRLGAVRGFAGYLQTLDPRVEVPPPGLIRNGPARLRLTFTAHPRSPRY